MSEELFNKLAQAEAKVHHKSPEDIHFHEVGALDSIVDIVSAAIGINALGIEKVYCSALSVGGGTVKCAHGLLPVPAPATAELIKNIPITTGPADVELLTPTAAAILTTITDQFHPLPPMKIETIGYGAGILKSDKFFMGKNHYFTRPPLNPPLGGYPPPLFFMESENLFLS